MSFSELLSMLLTSGAITDLASGISFKLRLSVVINFGIFATGATSLFNSGLKDGSNASELATLATVLTGLGKSTIPSLGIFGIGVIDDLGVENAPTDGPNKVLPRTVLADNPPATVARPLPTTFHILSLLSLSSISSNALTLPVRGLYSV